MEQKLLLTLIFFSLILLGCGLKSSEPFQSTYEKPAGKMRGIKAVAVFVELAKPPGASQEMSRNQLQTEVEAKIRQAGVTVVPQKTMSALPEEPLIYVNVRIAKIDEMYAYNIDILCMNASQGRAMPAKLAKCNLATSGLVADIVQVREKVADLVNLFIKDYLLVRGGTPAVSFLWPGPGQPSLRLTVPPA